MNEWSQRQDIQTVCKKIYRSKQFLSHRNVDSWNLLSSKIIEAQTVDSFFRRRLMRVVPSGEVAKTTYRPSNQVSK